MAIMEAGPSNASPKARRDPELSDLIAYGLQILGIIAIAPLLSRSTSMPIWLSAVVAVPISAMTFCGFYWVAATAFKPRRFSLRTLFVVLTVAGTGLFASTMIQRGPTELKSFRQPIGIVSQVDFSDGGTIEVVLRDADDVILFLRLNQDWIPNGFPPRALLIGMAWPGKSEKLRLPVSTSEVELVVASLKAAVCDAPEGQDRLAVQEFLDIVAANTQMPVQKP